MKKQVVKDGERNKPSPKWSGFFIAAWFLFVGAILFYTPVYIGIHGCEEKIINFFGWLAIVISFGGAFIELSNIFKNDGFSFLGVSLVFFVPAILLHILQSKYLSNKSGIIISKIIVILLLIIGSGLFLYGISFFLENLSNSRAKGEIAITKEMNMNKKSFIELISPIIIAILALATAIFQFISKISGK